VAWPTAEMRRWGRQRLAAGRVEPGGDALEVRGGTTVHQRDGVRVAAGKRLCGTPVSWLSCLRMPAEPWRAVE